MGGPEAGAGPPPVELLIADGDNRLYVDTASPALTAAAAKVLRGRTEATIEKSCPPASPPARRAASPTN